MIKLFTTAVMALCVTMVIGQGCDKLFISEYCEGSGNNKGFEIYNPTAEAIDLGPYYLQRFSNGENIPGDEINLQGTIQPYDVWVVVNGQLEDVELSGGSISPAVDPAMQEIADQLDNPYPAPTYMNGNDALVLIKNPTADFEIMDIFGKPGEDPGICWTDDAEAGYVTTEGSTFITANHTMRRKPGVTQGVVAPPTEFNGLAEYDTLAINVWTGLGLHCCVCDPNYDPDVCESDIPESIDESEALLEMIIFPNPATSSLTIKTDAAVVRYEVYSQEGRKVMDENLNSIGRNTTEINISELTSGRYLVNVHLSSGVVVSKPFVKQ